MQILSGGSTASPTCKVNLYIFGRNHDGTLAEPSKARIYNMKIYQYGNNPVLIRDYYPCRRKSDNAVGLYDVVRELFSPNLGTGKFLTSTTVPEEYQRIQYIEATGTQYIDLGFAANQNTGFDIDYMNKANLSTSGFGAIIGAKKSGGDSEYLFTSYTGSGSSGLMAWGNSTNYNIGMTKDTRIQHSLRNGVLTKPDGTTVTLPVKMFTTPCTLCLFCDNFNGTPAEFGKAIIYHVRFYNGDAMIRDLYPVYRKSDMEAGLYDAVNNVFYTNDGTGVFTIGTILPDEYQHVNYVEFNGAQYIDTGVDKNDYDTNSLNIRAKFCFNDTPTSAQMLYGVRANTMVYLQGYNGQWAFASGSDDTKSGTVVGGTNYNIEADYASGSQVLLVDGDLTISRTETGANIENKPIYVGRYNYSEDYNYLIGKLFFFQMNVNGETVRELYPCYRKADDEVGFYDVVNDVFYTNLGTGTFRYQWVEGMDFKKLYVGKTVIRLPSEYQEVEYIEGTGTQYINTGVYVDVNSLAMQIDFQLTNNDYDSGSFLIGGMGTSTMRFYISVLKKTETSSKAKRVDLGLGDGWCTDSDVADFNRHIWKVDMYNLKVYKDGESKTNTGGTYSKGTSSSMWVGIFGGSNGNGDKYGGCSEGYFYNAKIWQEDILIHNYVPCYRKSDNEVGLYDIIGGQFYSNSGTGDFIAGTNIHDSTARRVKYIYVGNEYNVAKRVQRVYMGFQNFAKKVWQMSVLPLEYQQVEYIASSGTQWIDTGTTFGYNASNYSEVYVKMEWLSNVTDERIPFGLRNSNGDTYMCFGYNGASNRQNWYLGSGSFTYSTDTPSTAGEVYEFTMYMEKGYQYLTLGGGMIISRSDNTDRLYTRNAWLFGSNASQGGNYRRLSSMKLYHSKIWRNGELVRDFYPCYRVSDDVAGLYDVVNNVFYTNAGTGTFTIGPKYANIL